MQWVSKVSARVRPTVMTAALLTTLISAFPSCGTAQTDPVPRLRVNVMVVFAQLETTVRYEFANGLLAAQVDFESHLGLAESQVLPAFIATYRIGGRHHVVGSYYQLRRTGSKQLEVDIPLPDTTLTLGTTLESRFDTRVFTLGYGYSLLQGPNGSITPYLALYLADWKANIGVQGSFVSRQTEVDLLAPLPMLGTVVHVTLLPRLLVSGNLGLFFFHIGDYDGSFVEANVHVGYQLLPFLGVGAGYAVFNVDVAAHTSQFTGGIRYRFNGPSLSATVSF